MDTLIDGFQTHQISLSTLITTILTNKKYRTQPCYYDLCSNATDICNALKKEAETAVAHWALSVTEDNYREEVRDLVECSPEWKFSALHASASKVEAFKIDEMASKIKIVAPALWSLLGVLLSVQKAKLNKHSGQNDRTPEDFIGDREPERWDQFGDIDLEGIIEDIKDDDQGSARQKRRAAKKEAVLVVKKVVIISVLMQSSNQKTNALESIIGVFLHSCRTPEKVIETLAHMGISISVDAIHNAITSLSRESAETIRRLGQTLLIAYAYDNFDVDLKTAVPTAEKSAPTLKHLTSALIFPLQHGISLDDMKVSEQLWKGSRNNPMAELSDIIPEGTWKDLLNIHPDTNKKGTLTRRQRFNSWKFITDLCTHGPQYFQQFLPVITEPDPVEKIPVLKTTIIPTRAMEFSNSTVSGNISTIRDLTEIQAGVGDPKNPDIAYEVKDGTQYVVLFHGDLGTGDRIHSIQLRRSIEQTPWNRFQYAVFVPGLFHVKMACADALWRILIQPKAARSDETSLMQDIAKLRPRETGIIGSNPGFRRMHEVILHTGICRRLDCWRMAISQQFPQYKTLQQFAESKPTLAVLQQLADHISQHYVADARIQRLRRQPEAQRDQQNENALLINQYSLLYEEMSYAMNSGDIGRVETCLVPWIFIFRATGKHKYATHMTRFLSNLHYVYPEGLKRAIRYNILVNPSGKEGRFRAVDWCVELNNLYTKDEHGGSSSNRSVDRIIKESPLVQIYRNTKTTIEKNFHLSHLTTGHAAPNMVRTFEEVHQHYEDKQPYKVTPGRQSVYSIPYVIDRGRMLMRTANTDIVDEGNEEAEGEVEGEDEPLEAEDILVDL